MTLLHRGLTIELPDDDARIPVIEALLFGKSLPPPIAEPPPPVALAPPPAPPAPPVEVPEKFRRAWAKLTALDRRELRALANGPLRPTELEQLLGLTQPKLMGQHSRISRVAFATGANLYVLSNGRGREARRFSVRSDVVAIIRALVAEEIRALQS